MDISILKQTVIDQIENFRSRKNVLQRIIPEELFITKKIVAISGIRRSGKSTLLWLIAEKVKFYYYLNFEDERLLGFNTENFNQILKFFMNFAENKKIFFLMRFKILPVGKNLYEDCLKKDIKFLSPAVIQNC